MSKAMALGKTSATSSFHLFLGKILSTVLLAVGTIVVTALIPNEAEYGLYAIAIIPSTLLLLFQDLGIGQALARHCAVCRASNNKTDLRKTIHAGIIFSLITSVVLTIISLLTANLIATYLFDAPESSYLVLIASIDILAFSASSLAQNIFIGFDRLDLTSCALFCQAVTQSTIAPVLVFFGYGAFGVLLGYMIGAIVLGMVSSVLFYFKIYRNLEKTSNRFNMAELIETLTPLLKFGIPLAVATILSGIMLQSYPLMMASFVKDLAQIGNYKVATNFAVLLTFFALPISTVLFPAFSKLNPAKEPELLKSVFSSSVRYSTLLIVPATIALIVLSQPLIGTLYGSKWAYAPSFLSLSILVNLLAIFGNLSIIGLLSGLGKTTLVMKMNMLTISIGLPMGLILIPSFGIVGMLVGSFVATIPSVFVGLYLVWKNYGLKIDFKASVKTLSSSVLSAFVVLLITSFPSSDSLRFLIGATTFLIVFLVSAPVFGAINQNDVNNLRVMTSGLGVLSKIVEVPLNIVERILKINLIHLKPRNWKNTKPFN